MKRTGPRWLTPRIEALLGKAPDGELAAMARVPREHIAYQRRKRGIKAPKRARAWLTPRIRAMLGTVADREVASKARVSVGTVARTRRSLGIAGFCGCAPPSMFATRRKS